ncbi:peptide/nickel transport system ATP-binding protein [Halobiforma haloterrestris]|uniref:Nickel import system ATP-binding protein NikD n=1 Tax=Natronobacterium haloterrestre TaxID=148448 RepID=A0A1I1DLF9_NATHA|nr:ABC transporter ATP-binding protein [Halobiforma haloterrestris]SFB75266.1 peptide/nickel transport system ATP-binding protein [Halobiforma haloterrestris]
MTLHTDDTTDGTDALGRGDREPLLTVRDLRTHITTEGDPIRAVDGVSFRIDRGETVCLVGESGSGKSVTCQSLTGLVPQPPAEIVGGTVDFDGNSLLELEDSDLQAIRGSHIAHVFQNPQSALDPVYTVGDQLVEAITIHETVSEREAVDRGIELLGRVGIPNAAARVDDYPHEFSGGMQQRVAIAIALAADPDLLIADEPTTAVDVTVQARLIELFRELIDGGMSLLLVTHDLRVVAALADRVLVMFGGTIVERGPVEELFDRPAHPYTRELMASYDGVSRRDDRSARGAIPGDGCRFRGECPHAVDDCAGGDQPAFHPVESRDAHRAACVYYGPERDPATIGDPTVENERRLLGGPGGESRE